MDGIYRCNHGGRQAASAPALQFLPGVLEAAGDLAVLFDSGVRTGVDAVKALALRAATVGIGRPYAYAAATGGTPAIEHLLVPARRANFWNGLHVTHDRERGMRSKSRPG